MLKILSWFTHKLFGADNSPEPQWQVIALICFHGRCPLGCCEAHPLCPVCSELLPREQRALLTASVKMGMVSQEVAAEMRQAVVDDLRAVFDAAGRN